MSCSNSLLGNSCV